MDKNSKLLNQLKKKQDQLKAQIQALEASERSRERKKETRRKILLGAYYLEKARSDGTFNELTKIMEGYLNRQSDRMLFDLLPVKSDKSPLSAE